MAYRLFVIIPVAFAPAGRELTDHFELFSDEGQARAAAAILAAKFPGGRFVIYETVPIASVVASEPDYEWTECEGWHKATK